MSTKNINKVIYSGETLIDLSADTVTAGRILSGATAHDKSGVPITGECTFDVDSSNATAAVAEILDGKTAYARSAVLTGTMPNNGAVTEVITAKEQAVVIPQGYYDGSGKVSIDAAEQAVLPDEKYNCLSQVTVLPILYAESENSAGGITVTIAG